MREIINNETYAKMQNYINDTLEHLKVDYDKGYINPIYYIDILHLSSVLYMICENEEKDKWEKMGYDMCKAIKQDIESYHLHRENISILAGFGYICYAVNLYSHATGRLQKFTEQLHELLMREITSMSIILQKNYEATTMMNYDCVAGISGALYYLLDYKTKSSKLYESTINEAINYLVLLTEKHQFKNDLVYNFHIKSEQQFRDEEKELYPDGNFNLGLSHGIIGPLLALSKAYKYGYRSSCVEKAIKIINNLYNDFKIVKDGISYWPGQLSYEEFKSKKVDKDNIHYAASWCYGNVGILRGLLVVAQNMGWNEYVQLYQNELISALNHSLDKFYLVSPALCHGYSSILAIKTCMLKQKSGQRLVNGLNDNINKIIELSVNNTIEVSKDFSLSENEDGRLEGCLGDYSLLTGVSGIVLLFLELLYGINEYKKILMII
ncbi:MAG: hypothetical protein E7222_05485 [Clostridiales bacterium]|nr:hypothetical protein [Clostridiales bacterium]